MTHDYAPHALDIAAFCKAQLSLTGDNELIEYARVNPEGIALDGGGAQLVCWRAQGRTPKDAAGRDELWLDLHIETAVPQICQRCLQPAMVALEIDRSFRFVVDEQTAATLDDVSDHDVLVISRRFDLHELIEDEILMALPLVPRHEVCPVQVRWKAEDADYERAQKESKRNPFAVLGDLKKKD